MTLYSDYIRAVYDDKTWPNHLKPGILAWSMLESGRCTTDVSKYTYNAHSMMWRAELGALYPNKYRFEGNDYFRFMGFKQELECLWKFIHRAVYGNVDAHMASIEDLLSFIGHSFCPPGYQDWWIARHLNCNYHQYIVKWMLPEAEDTLKILGWRDDMNLPAPQPVPEKKPYRVQNGLLIGFDGNPVPFFATPNYSKWVNSKPTAVVIHYTASLGISGIVNWFQNPQSQVSAHLLISQTGQIVQFVPFFRPAWAAGSAYWNQAVNIELEGLGCSRLMIGGKVLFPGWGGIKTVPVEDCLYAPHAKEPRIFRWWPYFTDAQYKALNDVIPALETEYGPLTLKGHSDVLATKLDPGMAFMWSLIKGEEGVVHK
jgi:hypothetical protein